MDNCKNNNIVFNKNEFQLKAKLSTYVIENISLLKNGYILIYFSKENIFSRFKKENLDSEKKKKKFMNFIFIIKEHLKKKYHLLKMIYCFH